MGLYGDMLATLQRREAELRAELEKVGTLRAAIEPLAATEIITAMGDVPTPSAPTSQLSIHQTSGPPMPIMSTVLNVGALKPTLAAVAENVLRDAGRPLPLKKIVEGVLSTWHWKGRSPKSIRSSLTPTLRRKTDVFDSPKHGFYGLQAWKVKKVG